MRAGKKSKDSLLTPADASLVIHKEATVFDLPAFSVCGGSGESNLLTNSAHGADRTQEFAEGGPFFDVPPQSAQPPLVINTTKTCPVAQHLLVSQPLQSSMPNHYLGMSKRKITAL